MVASPGYGSTGSLAYLSDVDHCSYLWANLQMVLCYGPDRFDLPPTDQIRDPIKSRTWCSLSSRLFCSFLACHTLTSTHKWTLGFKPFTFVTHKQLFCLKAHELEPYRGSGISLGRLCGMSVGIGRAIGEATAQAALDFYPRWARMSLHTVYR